MDFSGLKNLSKKFPEALDLVVEQLAEEMEKTCEKCNKDRIACSFSPRCSGRWWLDFLIEAGLPKTKLPHFCYERRRNEVERFLKQKDTLVEVKDARLYLSDFISIVKWKKNTSSDIKKSSELLEFIGDYLRKYFDSVHIAEENSSVFIFLDILEAILKLDFERQIAVINLKKERIKNSDTLLFMLNQWSQMLNIQTEVFSSPTALYMKTKFDSNSVPNITSIVEDLKTMIPTFIRPDRKSVV